MVANTTIRRVVDIGFCEQIRNLLNVIFLTNLRKACTNFRKEGQILKGHNCALTLLYVWALAMLIVTNVKVVSGILVLHNPAAC